jgi:hypothetical protein
MLALIERIRPWVRITIVAHLAVLGTGASIVPVLAAAALADPRPAPGKALTANRSTFSPADGAYKLTFPSGWTRSKVASPGAEITLIKNAPDSTFPSLMAANHAALHRGERSDFKGLADYAKRAFASRLKDLSVESDEDIKLAGEPAKRLVLVGKRPEDDRPLKMALVQAYHGRDTFVFTALGPSDEFGAVSADFDTFLKSFSFGPAGKSAAATPAASAPGRTKFENPDHKFTLTYNNRWGAVADPPAPRVMLLMPAVALKQQRLPTDVPELFVTVESGGRKPTLDQLQDKALNDFQAVAPDGRVVASDEVTLGGEPARRIVLEGRGRLGGPQHKSVTVFCVHDDSTYSVGCVGLSDGFDTNAHDLDAVVASFQFTRAGESGEANDGSKTDDKAPAEDKNKPPF